MNMYGIINQNEKGYVHYHMKPYKHTCSYKRTFHRMVAQFELLTFSQLSGVISLGQIKKIPVFRVTRPYLNLLVKSKKKIKFS